VPRTAIATQKGQAILMTLAANSVIINRRSNGYWAAEQRWISGDHVDVVRERKAYLDRRIRERAQGVTTAQNGAPGYPRANDRYTFDARLRTDLAQAYGGAYYPRPRYGRRRPHCRQVGGYEFYMRRTGRVCRLD